MKIFHRKDAKNAEKISDKKQSRVETLPQWYVTLAHRLLPEAVFS